jgi:pyridoxamine 5'-phosphate oxidase family protein
MSLTQTEQSYLAAQQRGRLATIAPDGSPQNKPVGFSYNAALGTIDIDGYNMSSSRKFRNILANPKVAFVVDDAPGQGAAGMRLLEIRGLAEAAPSPAPPDGAAAGQLIRIHPRRVVSWNLDPAKPGLQARDIDPDSSALRPDRAAAE